MKSVKLVKFNDGESTFGLTIGNIYQVAGTYKSFDSEKLVVTIEQDDDGDENELYEGEYEVFEE